VTFAIKFSELWTYSVSDTDRKLPVSALPEDGVGHIHGRLEILVAGRNLPYLGHFGPDDVCFGQWLPVLRDAVSSLRSKPNEPFTYDEGEQGQPAFRWIRKGDFLLISIVDSVLSDGKADPTWQDVECKFEDFTHEVAVFEARFRATVLLAAPLGGPVWFENHLRDAA
jgi:hypothetical protein